MGYFRNDFLDYLKKESYNMDYEYWAEQTKGEEYDIKGFEFRVFMIGDDIRKAGITILYNNKKIFECNIHQVDFVEGYEDLMKFCESTDYNLHGFEAGRYREIVEVETRNYDVYYGTVPAHGIGILYDIIIDEERTLNNYGFIYLLRELLFSNQDVTLIEEKFMESLSKEMEQLFYDMRFYNKLIYRGVTYRRANSYHNDDLE